MTPEISPNAISQDQDPWRDTPHVVVLCNFGGPAKADEVEPFLRRLFEDPFIIRAPLKPWLRQYLARRIAKKRAPKATAEYAEIGFSPINKTTVVQARHLEAMLQKKRPNTRVLVCNRYTPPYADEVARAFDPDACRLFLVTLYPHLCHSTTVSSLRDFDLAMERVRGRRDIPSTRVFSFWQAPRFLADGAKRIQAALEPLLNSETGPITILFSAHGIPERYNRRGDPYVTETRAHFAELKRRGEAWLHGIAGANTRCHWMLSFQSRVGPMEWVKPYTDETISRLGKERGGSLLVVPVSFTSDHIETLFEMDQTYRHLALSSGFKRYARVIPPNEDPELAATLSDVLMQHGF